MPPASPASPTALPQGTERFDGVEAALALSSALLSAERRHLWRLLAVFPRSFDSAAAAAVWAMEPEAGRVELETLVRTSLVDWEEPERRYRLHDFARSFAARSLAESERDAGERRHAEHFLRVLAGVEALYLQGGDSIQAALQTFDAEWGNFQAGQAWAARHLREGDAIARLCSDYVEAGTWILALRLNVRDLIEWRTLGLEAARQRNDKAAEGRHLGALGLLAASLGETRRALEFHEQDLALARELGDRSGEGTASWNCGLAYEAAGNLAGAVGLMQIQVDYQREIGHSNAEPYAAYLETLRSRLREQPA